VYELRRGQIVVRFVDPAWFDRWSLGDRDE
jgi:hypothetical protein